MSDPTPAATPETTDAPARPAFPLLLVLVVAGALAAGAACGAFLVAPRLRPPVAVAAADGHGEAHGDAHDGESSGGHGKKGHGKAPLHKIDNLIVNPAGTQGTRFLMVTVAFESPDARTMERLVEKDLAVRDRVVSVLERRTLEELTRPGARDSLRGEIAQAVTPIAGRRPNVLLPQFVIQ